MNTLKDFVNWKLTHSDKVSEAEGYPLIMEKCKKNKKTKQLKIYGNSVQDGTPTPENPIEVHSVGEKSVNLTDGILEVGGIANATGQNSNSAGYFRSVNYTLIIPNTVYTITASKPIQFVYFYDKDYNFINLSVENARTFTTPENCEYIRYRIIRNESIENETVDKVMLVLGSTDTTYEPYGKYKITVVQRGKNAFCHNAFRYSSATLIESGYNSDGSEYAILKGNVNSSITDQMMLSQGWYEPARYSSIMTLRYGQTVTISADITALERHDEKCQECMRIYLFAMGGVKSYTPTTNIWYEIGKKQRVSMTIKLTDSKFDNLAWYPIFTLNSHTIRIENIMIEVNNEVTPYEPYVEPITTNIFLNEPLRKIGDYADYVDFKNNKVVRHIKECVLDGVSTGRKINAVTLYSSGLYYSLCTGQRGISNGAENVLKNTHFKASTKLEKGQCYMTSNATACRMVHPNQELNTVELWNEWLQKLYNNSSPVTFDYVLKEPTEEPITIELPKLTAKTTVIEVDTSLAPSDAYGKYIKK